MEGDKVYAGYRITAAAGKKYKTNHYNLQAIIAVGFKVDNDCAARFRKWAGQIVKDYTIQGWIMDVERKYSEDRIVLAYNPILSLSGFTHGGIIIL